MKRSKFDERQDQNAVQEYDAGRSLMCRADRCPNRWSVDDGHLCSAHAWSSAHLWPRITQEQLDYLADLARRNAEPKRAVSVDKYAVMERLRGMRVGNPNPKAWAKRLRLREESGERLKPIQRKAWREVLTERPSDEWMEPA